MSHPQQQPLPPPDLELIEWIRHKVTFYRQLAFMAALASLAMFLPPLESRAEVGAYIALGIELIALAGWFVSARRLRALNRQVDAAAADDWAYVRGLSRVPAVVDISDVDEHDPARVEWSCQGCKAGGSGGPLNLIDAVGHVIAAHGPMYLGQDHDERRTAIIDDWQQQYRSDPQRWQWVINAQEQRRMRVLPTV